MWGRNLYEVISKLEFSDNSLLDLKHVTSYTNYFLQNVINYLLGIYKRKDIDVSSNVAVILSFTGQNSEYIKFPQIEFTYDENGDAKFTSSPLFAVVGKYGTNIFSDNNADTIPILVMENYGDVFLNRSDLEHILSVVFGGGVVYVVLNIDENYSYSDSKFPKQVVISAALIEKRDILKVNKVNLVFTDNVSSFIGKYAFVIGRIFLDNGKVVFAKENYHLLVNNPPYITSSNWSVFAKRKNFLEDDIVNSWNYDLSDHSVSSVLASVVRMAHRLPYISGDNAIRKGILDFNKSCKIYTRVSDPLHKFPLDVREAEISVVFEFDSYESEIVLDFYTKKVILSPKLVAENRSMFFDDVGYSKDVEAYEDLRTKKGYIVFKAKVPSFLRNSNYTKSLGDKQGVVLFFVLAYDSRKDVLRPGWKFNVGNFSMILYNYSDDIPVSGLNAASVYPTIDPFDINSTNVVNDYYSNLDFPIFAGDVNNSDVPQGFLGLRQSSWVLQHYEYKKPSTLTYAMTIEVPISDYRTINSSGVSYSRDPSVSHLMYQVNASDTIPLAMVFVLKYTINNKDYLFVRCPSILYGSRVILDIEADTLAWEDGNNTVICEYKLNGGTAVIAPFGNFLIGDISLTSSLSSRLNTTLQDPNNTFNRTSLIERSKTTLDRYFKIFGDSLSVSSPSGTRFNGLNILALDPNSPYIPGSLYEGTKFFDVGNEFFIGVPGDADASSDLISGFNRVRDDISNSDTYFSDYVVYIATTSYPIKPIIVGQDVTLDLSIRHVRSGIVYDFGSYIIGDKKITFVLDLSSIDLDKIDYRLEIRNLFAKNVEINVKLGQNLGERKGKIDFILSNCKLSSLTLKSYKNNSDYFEFPIYLIIRDSSVSKFFIIGNGSNPVELSGIEISNSVINFNVGFVETFGFGEFIRIPLYNQEYTKSFVKIVNSRISFDASSVTFNQNIVYLLFSFYGIGSLSRVLVESSRIYLTVSGQAKISLLLLYLNSSFNFEYFNDKDCFLNVRNNYFEIRYPLDVNEPKFASVLLYTSDGISSRIDNYQDVNNYYKFERMLLLQ